MCGSNNCKKFGAYFHEKDDCCDRPENVPLREEPTFVPGAPLEPPKGSIIAGRILEYFMLIIRPEMPRSEL